MKHWIIALFGSLVLFQRSVEAAPKCQALNVYRDDMVLSPLQNTMVSEIRELHKEKYQITKDFHQTRLDLMVDFLQGNNTRSDVEKVIQTTHDERMTQDNELKVGIFELLESFSAVQKEQLQHNLNSQQQCLKNNLKTLKENRPKIGKMLFQGLNLSQTQQEMILNMYLDRRDFSSVPSQYGLHHEELVLGYLEGTIDMRTSEWLFENKASVEGRFRQAEIDDMMALLESFTPEQRSQFIANIEEIKNL